MQPILRDVQQIQSSDEAFAAILWDGTVVTWGQDRLSPVEDTPKSSAPCVPNPEPIKF